MAELAWTKSKPTLPGAYLIRRVHASGTTYEGAVCQRVAGAMRMSHLAPVIPADYTVTQFRQALRSDRATLEFLGPLPE